MSLYSSHYNNILDNPITDHVIVLDLDETLIHTSETMNGLKKTNIFKNVTDIDLRNKIYKLVLDDVCSKNGTGVKSELWGIHRPDLKEFLTWCFSYFKIVAVWSAGLPKYVDAIVENIFRDVAMPHIIYARDKCVRTDGILEKPLINMMSNVEDCSEYMKPTNTFIIDDRYSTFQRVNHTNAIHIPPFSPVSTGLRVKDTSLTELMTWFNKPEVINSTDIRTLDKSGIFTGSSRYD